MALTTTIQIIRLKECPKNHLVFSKVRLRSGQSFSWNKDFDVETGNQPNLVGHKKQQNMQSNSSLVVELNQPFFEKKTRKSNWCSFFPQASSIGGLK